MKLVLATHNKGKIREFQKVFSEIGWEAVPVADVSDAPDPEETGKTFKENALQKAHYYAKVTNLPVLSDDSGIIADVLGDRRVFIPPVMQESMAMMRPTTENLWKT